MKLPFPHVGSIIEAGRTAEVSEQLGNSHRQLDRSLEVTELSVL